MEVGEKNQELIKGKSLRILLVNDPGIPVPPVGYGGIERIVGLLAKEYSRLGHRVDLLASAGSEVDGCRTFSIGPDGFPPSKQVMRNAILLAGKFLWQNRNKYDLIHSFGRLLYLLPILNHPVKKIMSYQREIRARNADIFTKLPHKNLVFSGCSQNLIDRSNPPGKWKAIYNAIDFSAYDLTTDIPMDSPFVFLGRIEKIKGCHTAIKVVKEANERLIIAGNISNIPEEYSYFEKKIKPHIDGEQIQYIGEVNDIQKNKLLGGAKALLMPIEWNEPFGIVMIESMACGTPVIGCPLGAVPEVVEEGITGFKGSDLNVLLGRLAGFNRRKCRLHAERRFSIARIAEEYLSV